MGFDIDTLQTLALFALAIHAAWGRYVNKITWRLHIQRGHLKGRQ